jgi:hypothetical protein
LFLTILKRLHLLLMLLPELRLLRGRARLLLLRLMLRLQRGPFLGVPRIDLGALPRMTSREIR